MPSPFDKIIEFFTRLRSGGISHNNRRFERVVEQIRQQESTIRQSSITELSERATKIRLRARQGVPLRALIPESFAVTSEVAWRTLAMRPFDVQLLAGVALAERNLVEMQTGEGKTLAAVLPVSLWAASGQGVHVLTFNDYLAERDAVWMGPIYRALGLTVGFVVQGMSREARREAYRCDVTYVTAKEAGFDFLRDQTCMDPGDQVHRHFPLAVIDEADSILIDEARIPLVIAAAEQDETKNLELYADLIRSLQRGRHYDVDERWRNVFLQPSGLDRLEHELNCGELYSEQNLDRLTRLNLALQAEVLLQRDRDYLVRDNEVVLIDDFTGRVAADRRWPYGLQAAIEAKESLPIQPQGRILNSITLQHFLRQYEAIAGMTGTAREAADELYEFYQTRVVVVPTHRPCVRRDLPDRIYPTKREKYLGLINAIRKLHQRGAPVLVGTASVEESELLASLLSQMGTPCLVLNARNDAQEAQIIAEAGAWGAVTISTNMAGRGTDIRLGGSDERDREAVIAAGGLHVLGTNRHESRRIDNQLRGRAGRQGDPGETGFYVSLEDDLMVRYGIGKFLNHDANSPSLVETDFSQHHETIEHIQRIIENESFQIRRTLRNYSFVLEQQRGTIHERRNRILFNIDNPSLCESKDPELFERRSAVVGEDVVRAAERVITLWSIDRCWSEYLTHVASIRDQIHVISMTGFNPVDEYNRLLTQAFRELTHRITRQILSKLATVHLTPAGLNPVNEGLIGPTSTWTYMINDNPMGDTVERIQRSLKRILPGRLQPPR